MFREHNGRLSAILAVFLKKNLTFLEDKSSKKEKREREREMFHFPILAGSNFSFQFFTRIVKNLAGI